MSQSYVKECIFCKEKIRMSDKEGKWLPYNQDGSLHDCKKSSKNGSGNGEDKKEVTLEMVVKKLESIGVIINVERLMKE
jgi:hypothetical protein